VRNVGRWSETIKVSKGRKERRKEGRMQGRKEEGKEER